MDHDKESHIFHKTEPVYCDKTPSTAEIRSKILSEGFQTDEIRLSKSFLATMVCRNAELLPRGQHLVVAIVKNVITKKEPRHYYITFQLAEKCQLITPLPPQFIEKIPEKLIQKNSSWIRECASLYAIRSSFSKPKVVKFKVPIDLVDGIKSKTLYISSNPSLVYDLENKIQVDVSIDKISQIIIASESTICEAEIE